MSQLHPIAMLLACACIIIAVQTCAQDNTSLTGKVVSFPTRFLNNVNQKATRLEDNIIAKSDRALKQMAREERRLQKKLFKKDSLLAKKLFADAQTQYESLQTQL